MINLFFMVPNYNSCVLIYYYYIRYKVSQDQPLYIIILEYIRRGTAIKKENRGKTRRHPAASNRAIKR